MSLLFDENLSEALVGLLSDVFPGCRHVRLVGLEGQPDEAVAAYSLQNDLTIVTEDRDFIDRIAIEFSDLRIVLIRLGNCTTANVHLLLRNGAEAIVAFLGSEDLILELPAS